MREASCYNIHQHYFKNILLKVVTLAALALSSTYTWTSLETEYM